VTHNPGVHERTGGAPHASTGRVAAIAALAALAVAVAACGGPPPDRALPIRIKAATFLAVTNDAGAPLIVGSSGGVYSSRDAGRTWHLARPRAFGALAVTFTRTNAIFSRGRQKQVTDLALRGLRGRVVEWPFAGDVTALASDPGHHQVWARLDGRPGGMMYSNNDGRTFFPTVTLGLPSTVLAMTALVDRTGQATARVFAACGKFGLYESQGVGTAWTRVPGIDNAVDVDATLTDDSFLVVATPVVEISRDGGATFTAAPLTASRVAVDPRNVKLVYAVAENGRLYQSVDGGRHF
jgi:hypothetical protein